jgi:spore maturation protein CgeB
MIEAGWSPSVRLFEAAACGTPIISDTWPGLSDFFAPGREIEIAAHGEDVLKVVRGTADSLGRAARGKVIAEHSAEHRAAELERHLTARLPALAAE